VIELAQEIPDVEVLLNLEVEDLALTVLELLKRRGADKFHPTNLCNELFGRPPPHTAPYPSEKQGYVEQALTESFAWLEAQVLIVPASGQNGSIGWRVLGRRAMRMSSEADFSAFRAGKTLPRQLLHDRFAERVWLHFVRGHYDTAVFEAMKEVEVSVRTACGFGQSDLGVQLMRQAFGKRGPLSDPSAQEAERDALCALFAGAIGSYKNPQSHRHVKLDAQEAAQIILLASHLLTIVDARSPKRQ
jgi:uncharacterized protein (TIGR02391 family)